MSFIKRISQYLSTHPEPTGPTHRVDIYVPPGELKPIQHRIYLDALDPDCTLSWADPRQFSDDVSYIDIDLSRGEVKLYVDAAGIIHVSRWERIVSRKKLYSISSTGMAKIDDGHIPLRGVYVDPTPLIANDRKPNSRGMHRYYVERGRELCVIIKAVN